MHNPKNEKWGHYISTFGTHWCSSSNTNHRVHTICTERSRQPTKVCGMNSRYRITSSWPLEWSTSSSIPFQSGRWRLVVFEKKYLQAHIEKLALYAMDLTPSPRKWERMLSSYFFHLISIFIPFSIWRFSSTIVHLYWTLQ